MEDREWLDTFCSFLTILDTQLWTWFLNLQSLILLCMTCDWHSYWQTWAPPLHLRGEKTEKQTGAGIYAEPNSAEAPWAQRLSDSLVHRLLDNRKDTFQGRRVGIAPGWVDTH